MEREPLGPYFPGLGQYDMTGDGVVDLVLLGVTLLYYRAGNFGEDVDVYLTNGTSGYVISTPERGTFTEPRDYYRPIPANQVTLNPELDQPFGWQ